MHPNVPLDYLKPDRWDRLKKRRKSSSFDRNVPNWFISTLVISDLNTLWEISVKAVPQVSSASE